MNKRYLAILFSSWSFLTLNAQNVTIPDATFKAYLVGISAINTNGDSEIQVSEAVAYTGALDVANASIVSLTGIEAFSNLSSLDCSDNSLTSLDVSQNLELTNLYCVGNQLTVLGLGQNTMLIELYCGNNQLTSLNVDQNTALEVISCDHNQLDALSLNNNAVLNELVCNDNQLTSLDVSNNSNLELLYCNNNSLTSLEINTGLEYLFCQFNALTSLNLTTNTDLEQLNCRNNQLTGLNVANGNNPLFGVLYANNNPNLTCIQVDDAAWSTTNWASTNFEFDSGTSFSENCSGSTMVPAAPSNLSATNANPPVINLTWSDNATNENGFNIYRGTDPFNMVLVDDNDANDANWNDNQTGFLSSGTYYYEVCAYNNSGESCSGIAQITIENTAGIAEATVNTLLSISPNPVNSTLNIEVKAAVAIKIVNPLGETVAAQQLNAGNNTVEVNHLTNGVYFIQSDATGTAKFIKE